MNNDNYKLAINDWYEDGAVKLLNAAFAGTNFSAKRNNKYSNDIDIAIYYNHICVGTLDVQYSFDFKKYGDVRCDYISAGAFKEPNATPSYVDKELKNGVPIEELLTVYKYGKFFQANTKFLGVLYFIYDGPKPSVFDLDNLKKCKSNSMMWLSSENAVQAIKNQCGYIHINDKKKHDLTDKHQSAFVCYKVRQLLSKGWIKVITSKAMMPSITDDIIAQLMIRHPSLCLPTEIQP